MENMGELADQRRMGGSSEVEAAGDASSPSNANANASAGVPSTQPVDAVEPLDSVQSVQSVHSVGSVSSARVDTPDLLPAHEIAAHANVNTQDDDQSASPVAAHDDQPATQPHTRPGSQQSSQSQPPPAGSTPPPDADELDAAPLDEDEDDEQDAAVMIDAGDFRGVLSEPTYQTLNGRMTPPGFPTSSSYATLTPLQPLPPISTMSDKFSHYGHSGNGGFALMQNVSMGGHHYAQYDKLGSAMAAAGMNLQNMAAVNVGHMNVNVSLPHQSHQANANAQHLMNAQQVAGLTHAAGQTVIPSPPYHANGLSSPDKSLSPPNGYEYAREQRVLGSPQSPSSINLHSPNSLLPSLNGLPATPPSAQMPPSPPSHTQACSTHSNAAISLQASQAQQQHLTYVTTSGQDVKVATTLTAAPQRVTVLQAVTPTPAAIAPQAHAVTIVQTASAAAVSNLATTIVSTPGE